ncbi:MAG: glycerophosphodiester phosphodiesterase family protein [Bacteroidales bacterium]|nr:glycerophosphodiester phosphodiesterase family protein [Bacteroidales bacterium]
MNRIPVFAFILATIVSCGLSNKQASDQSNPQPASSQASKKSISVVVHRGANSLAPENTMPSADSALVHGAEWIEVDVRTTADGVMYNLHDDELERTTNGHGKLSESKSSYIETLDAGSWFGEAYKGLKVPTMRAMLEGLQGRAKVFFDVKNGTPIPAVVSLVRETGFTDKSFFWFAKEEMLREFLSLAPEMKVKVNASDTARLQYWLDLFAEYKLRPAIVEVNADCISPEFTSFCRKHDILIMVGAQGESIDDYKAAIETGADLINLDKPELFEQLL